MYKFIRYDNEGMPLVTLQEPDQSWPELTEAFFRYLQACGFVLTRERFAEEIQEMFGENK